MGKDLGNNLNRENNKFFLWSGIGLLILAAIMTAIVGGMYGGEPLNIDIRLQSFFFSLRGTFSNPIGIFITHLSDTWFIVGFLFLLVLLPNRKQYGFPVLIAEVLGLAIYKPLKHIIMRARPDKALHLVSQGGFSFPSGHSVTSVIVYGLLFYLVGRYVKNKKLKLGLQSVLAFLVSTIGLSRIFVGVHWPTDVLTGWFIGGGILLLSIYVLRIKFEK